MTNPTPTPPISNDTYASCGNCHQPWPCQCVRPHWVCDICANDQNGCKCDERSYPMPGVSPTPPPAGEQSGSLRPELYKLMLPLRRYDYLSGTPADEAQSRQFNNVYQAVAELVGQRLAQVEAENTALEQEVAYFKSELSATVHQKDLEIGWRESLRADRDRLAAENERLQSAYKIAKGAFFKCGNHDSECRIHTIYEECDCGYNEAAQQLMNDACLALTTPEPAPPTDTAAPSREGEAPPPGDTSDEHTATVRADGTCTVRFNPANLPHRKPAPAFTAETTTRAPEGSVEGGRGSK